MRRYIAPLILFATLVLSFVAVEANILIPPLHNGFLVLLGISLLGLVGYFLYRFLRYEPKSRFGNWWKLLALIAILGLNLFLLGAFCLYAAFSVRESTTLHAGDTTYYRVNEGFPEPVINRYRKNGPFTMEFDRIEVEYEQFQDE